MQPLDRLRPAAPGTLRTSPATVVRALDGMLRQRGITRVYSAAYAIFGVVSVNPDLTVRTNGRVLQWHCNGVSDACPTADIDSAAERLAALAGEISWSRTEDRSARTRPAREKFLQRFEREVDPDGKLPADERRRRPEHAKRAYLLRLAKRAVQGRAQRPLIRQGPPTLPSFEKRCFPARPSIQRHSSHQLAQICRKYKVSAEALCLEIRPRPMKLSWIGKMARPLTRRWCLGTVPLTLVKL